MFLGDARCRSALSASIMELDPFGFHFESTLVPFLAHLGFISGRFRVNLYDDFDDDFEKDFEIAYQDKRDQEDEEKLDFLFDENSSPKRGKLVNKFFGKKSKK